MADDNKKDLGKAAIVRKAFAISISILFFGIIIFIAAVVIMAKIATKHIGSTP